MNPEDVLFPEGLKKTETYLQETIETLGHRENTRNLLLIGPNKVGKHSVEQKLATLIFLIYLNMLLIIKHQWDGY